MNTDTPKLVRVITRMNIGGPARHVTILTAGGAPEFECTLLTGESAPREGSLFAEAVQTGGDIRHVPFLQRSLSPVNDLLALIWLVRYFRRERPAIVATHTAKAGTLGRIAAALAGVPVVIHTFHGHVLEGYFGKVETLIFLTIERLLGRITTAFVAISPRIAADLERLGIGRGKTVIVPLGLELDYLSRSQPGRLRRDLGIPDDAITVGIVGRLAPIKAHDLFIQSAAQLIGRYRQVHFAVVGDGELWNQLHRQVREGGLASRIHFAGWRRQLEDVYSDLDIVVCCSRNEGTPVALIEASAAGRAVVGTRVGGIPDVVVDGVTGLLVQFGDVNALADAIGILIQNPERRRSMGVAGRELVLKKHSADRMVKELKEIYSRLLENAALKLEAV